MLVGYFIFFIVIFILLFVLNLQYKWIYPSHKKLRILEYHSISIDGFEDQVTISKEKIIQQFEYLKKHNYKTFWFSEIDEMIKNKVKLPAKSVVLTFDDGYLDNYTELYPLLQKYNFKAVCFMVLGRIGQQTDWSGEFANHSMQLMNEEQMKEVKDHIEFGYHSYKHDNYAFMNLQEVEEDIEKCKAIIREKKLTIFPALAYTYGGYYRKKDLNQIEFFKVLERTGIKYALRIGNRINTFPFKNNYEIQRIDIRGYEPLSVFKIKILLGRTLPF